MALVFVGNASPAGVYVSHITNILSTPSDRGRNGSLNIRHGRRITSESSPGAWPVRLYKMCISKCNDDIARCVRLKIRVLVKWYHTTSTNGIILHLSQLNLYFILHLSQLNSIIQYLMHALNIRDHFT